MTMDPSFLQPAVEKCAQLIADASRIGVLTGAGISTAAGIPDFRGPKGLYVTKRYDPNTVFDIKYFGLNPKPFYEFARDFLVLEEKIQPTYTHGFLARLEQTGKLKGIVTQNIDALHHKAGSKNVFEVHGSFWKSFCIQCHMEFTYEQMKQKILTEEVPGCPCGGIIKPDVVFFGENVKYWEEASQLAETSDLFLVIGSSCTVHPAASIPALCHGEIAIINQGDIFLNAWNIALTVDCDIDTFFKQLDQHGKGS